MFGFECADTKYLWYAQSKLSVLELVIHERHNFVISILYSIQSQKRLIKQTIDCLILGLPKLTQVKLTMMFRSRYRT